MLFSESLFYTWRWRYIKKCCSNLYDLFRKNENVMGFCPTFFVHQNLLQIGVFVFTGMQWLGILPNPHDTVCILVWQIPMTLYAYWYDKSPWHCMHIGMTNPHDIVCILVWQISMILYAYWYDKSPWHCMHIGIVNITWIFEMNLNNGFWEMFAAIFTKVMCRPSWNSNQGNRRFRIFWKIHILIVMTYFNFQKRIGSFYCNLETNILAAKLSRAIWILSKIRFYVPANTL